MAFDLKDKNEHTSSINGEIVISTETAVRNSKIYKTKQYDELLLYVIHGVLHLCGFNDHKKQETKLMRKREQYILQKIS